MNAKNKNNVLLPAAFALLSLLGGAAYAADGVQPVDAGTLSLDRGSQKVVRDTGPIRRVAIGDPAVADAFCASRLGGDYGEAFGTLPAGTDFEAIIERAIPA